MFARTQFDSAIVLTSLVHHWQSAPYGRVLAAVIVAAGTFALEYSLVGVVALYVATTVFAVMADMSARRFFRELVFHVVSST